MLRLRRLSCSFCHRNQSAVAKLVGGGGTFRPVFICDECAAMVTEIMKSSDEGASQPQARTGGWFRRLFTALSAGPKGPALRTGHRAGQQPLCTEHHEPAGVMS